MKSGYLTHSCSSENGLTHKIPKILVLLIINFTEGVGKKSLCPDWLSQQEGTKESEWRVVTRVLLGNRAPTVLVSNPTSPCLQPEAERIQGTSYGGGLEIFLKEILKILFIHIKHWDNVLQTLHKNICESYLSNVTRRYWISSNRTTVYILVCQEAGWTMACVAELNPMLCFT